jgi:two-component system KDP operon response regulator KdpE
MSNGPKILIVDDEPQIRRFLRASLGAHQFHIVEAETGDGAIKTCAAEQPDLTILDLGLPDMDGLDVIARIREWSAVPILVLSVRADEADKIDALDRGADDYITKPFGVGELMARVRAALRHGMQANDQEPVFVNDDLRVDLVRRQVNVAGNEVHLSPKEYDLLKELVTHSGRVLTHQHLLRNVWGPAHVEETQYLRVYIGQLRQKVEPDPARPRYIVTEPGVGYRLKEPVAD